MSKANLACALLAAAIPISNGLYTNAQICSLAGCMNETFGTGGTAFVAVGNVAPDQEFSQD